MDHDGVLAQNPAPPHCQKKVLHNATSASSWWSSTLLFARRSMHSIAVIDMCAVVHFLSDLQYYKQCLIMWVFTHNNHNHIWAFFIISLVSSSPRGGTVGQQCYSVWVHCTCSVLRIPSASWKYCYNIHSCLTRFTKAMWFKVHLFLWGYFTLYWSPVHANRLPVEHMIKSGPHFIMSIH